jgi:hypothetical protein
MFRSKYIKYKAKYLKLSQQYGGVGDGNDEVGGTVRDGNDEGGGAAKPYKRLQLKPLAKLTIKDTPLMKLLFIKGFHPEMPISQIHGGLDRLDKLFCDNKDVSEVIDQLATIEKIGIDEIISTIKKMQESLNRMETQCYPEKYKVKEYLLFLIDGNKEEDWRGHGEEQKRVLKPGLNKTPLMKLLFTDVFDPEMSISQIEGGLDRLYSLFVDPEKVSEVIHQLTMIDKPGIDKIISTIEKMHECLNKIERNCYPEKDDVKKYLLRLYQEKKVAHENSRLETFMSKNPK